MEQLTSSNNYYDVFVGHLPQEMTDHDLLEIFKGCRGIAHVRVIEASQDDVYKFGFVKFHAKEDALSVVAERNRWIYKGARLLVDLAKNTKDRIDEEKQGVLIDVHTAPYWKSPEHQASSQLRQTRSKSHCVEQDVLNMSRLKETCNDLNLKMMRGVGSKDDEQQFLDLDHLIDDIEKSPFSREPTYVGDYDDSRLEFITIKDRLLNRTSSNGSTLGEQREKKFINALQEIKETVNVFVNSSLPMAQTPKYESDLQADKNKNNPCEDTNKIHENLHEVSNLSSRSLTDSGSGEEYNNTFDDDDSALPVKLSDKLESIEARLSCDGLSDCDSPNDSGIKSDFQSRDGHRLNDHFQNSMTVDDSISKTQKEMGGTGEGSHRDKNDVFLQFLQTVGRGRGLSTPTTRNPPQGPVERGFHNTFH